MRRAVVALVLGSCTFGDGPAPPRAPRPPPATQMTPAELDRSEPGANTSENPDLSRSDTRGCHQSLTCGTGGDTSSGLVLLAVLQVLGRRRRIV